MAYRETTFEAIQANYPELRADNPDFLDPLSEADIASLKKFISIQQKELNMDIFSSKEEDVQDYILHTYLMHHIYYDRLPAMGKLPKIQLGDQPSSSISEGSVSLSTTRQDVQVFKVDPTYAYTDYGIKFAKYFRDAAVFTGVLL